MGNKLSSTSPLGETSTTTYDLLNHPLLVTAPDGTASLDAYNNYAQLTSSTARLPRGRDARR